MSALGPLGGVPAISAAARIVRSNGEVNQAHQNQAVEGQANLRAKQATREIGEEGVGVGDREADGRQAWHPPANPDGTATQPETGTPLIPATPSTGSRGQRLDVNL